MLSPLDEQEEWAKISEIMASFGTGLVRESVFVTELEKEFQARLGLNLTENSSSNDQISSVGQWLQSLGLSQYETTFTNYGYDNLDFMNGVLDDADLKDMGVVHEEERQKILESANALPKKVVEAYLDPVNNNNNNNSRNNNENVDQWLTRLDLSAYCDTFRRHLYTDMERVRNVWEVELTAVLEMGKPGHRHRILASLPNRGNQPTIQDINADLTQLKSSIQELEGKTGGGSMSVAGGTSGGPGTTGTLRHSHKKSRPAPQPPAPDLQIRDPSQLLKLKKPQSELKTSPDIYLSISYRGVKFLSADTKELVCEHEIRNIHCACQDAEDLTHFAYITKDHASKSHYCHVFCVQTMDQATEVILTLGQAFEVAYQMALREGQSSVRGGNGHTRSHSANQIMEPTGPGAVTRQPQPTHSRSHSANGQVLLEAAAAAAASSTITNGHPHPPTPPAPPKTPLLLAEEHV
ncbi:hypothetical protein AAG570_007789 [Ranatra chinensis]|uniref:Ankyrin repeat and sterile alpha motif domain-containing protein 1B n=1 Tax=Ranatra chinensis TaxID=642074 RepID=A0ABD0XUM3_9HEMI